MIRPLETLTEKALLEEGVVEYPPATEAALARVRIAPGVKLRVGPGQAELVAKRILGGAPPELVVDASLQPHEWAPVWEGAS